tara:strand:+ start:59 stop:709 length:651 start_codon:yes stop_codon:yes gene_type:complete
MINTAINLTSAGLILVDEKLNSVIVQQFGKSWCFPKGHIEPGESSYDCASREFREETGLTAPMPTGDRSTMRNSNYTIAFTNEPPVETVVTRRVFTGKGWDGELKSTKYYLATPKGAHGLCKDLDLSGHRDDDITDVRVVDYNTLLKMTQYCQFHPGDFNALSNLVTDMISRYKGNRKNHWRPTRIQYEDFMCHSDSFSLNNLPKSWEYKFWEKND